MARPIMRSRPRDGRPPASRRQADAYPGVVYAIVTRTPRVGLHLGYVGQSRRLAEVRLEEHRACQPWGDLIAHMVVIAEGMWTDTQLTKVEMHYIQHGVAVAGLPHQRPTYNIDYNRDNPNRVLPWDAATARQQRQPGWTPPQQRIPRQRDRRTTTTAAAVSYWRRVRRAWRWMPRWARTAATAAAVWAALTISLFVMRDAWTGWTGLQTAAGVSGAGLGGVWWMSAHLGKRKRRSSSRRRRR